MAWKTILLPHDFGPCAARAERLAVELAEVHGAELVLLHVASKPPEVSADEPPSEPSGAADSHSPDPKSRLEHIAATLRAQGVRVLAEARVGELIETILEEAQRSHADAIVMGTRGRRGLSRLLLGNVAEEVLRRADVPVVTIRYEDEESVTPLLVPITAS